MTHPDPTDIRIARMILRTVRLTEDANRATGRRLRREPSADHPDINTRLLRRIIRDDAERFDITPASVASARALLAEVDALIESAFNAIA